MSFPAPEGADLVEHLGAGTTFDVALVREQGRVVVCKRLRPRMQREAAARAALVREARLLAMTKHPSLPSIVRVGQDAHGPFVLETRTLGVSLRALGDAWRARVGDVPAHLVAHVALEAASALADVHEIAFEGAPLDVVHGDLAPDHVMFGPLGEIGFLDFGAARFRGLEASADPDARGTLPFVAPELARGEVTPSAATDVFALAATIVAFATGGPLTASSDEAARLVEVAERGVGLGLVARVPLPPPARAALSRALAFDPTERLSSARALALALASR